MKQLIVVVLLLLAAINPLLAQSSTLKKATFQIDSLTRECYFHVPPANLSKNAKLIFAIHGSGGSPQVMQSSTGFEFDSLADLTHDAIIAYPAGYHTNWNDCRSQANFDARLKHIDDVSFFGKMISYFHEQYGIDTTAVFAVGHSNGGHMCYKLALEKPQWFRAVAAISASLPVRDNNDCYIAHLPISVLVMNGTSDPVSPYNGGEVVVGGGQKRGAVISTDETIQYWLTNDSCNTQPRSTMKLHSPNNGNGMDAVEYIYGSNKTNQQVALVKIIGGTHSIPLDKTVNGPCIIWDFFSKLKP